MAIDLQTRIRAAITHFWTTRETQSQRQGAAGSRDAGLRTAVTGGKQMDGFIQLVRDLLLEEAGVSSACCFIDRHVDLPGYFRSEKQWDLLVVADGNLLASIEFKSQVGPSFGNNYNNRTEEALGCATDLWAAYREGAFRESQRPWLGYLMLLEEAPRSTTPVKTREPHFPVFGEFRGASYAKRYEILCHKLVRERLYDAACFMMSDAIRGAQGYYHEPSQEIGFQPFAASLLAKMIAYLKTKP